MSKYRKNIDEEERRKHVYNVGRLVEVDGVEPSDIVAEDTLGVLNACTRLCDIKCVREANDVEKIELKRL